MPTYFAAGVSMKLATHAIPDPESREVFRGHGKAAQRELASAEAALASRVRMTEEPVECLVEQGDEALKFLGKNMQAPFYCIAVNQGLSRARSKASEAHSFRTPRHSRERSTVSSSLSPAPSTPSASFAETTKPEWPPRSRSLRSSTQGQPTKPGLEPANGPGGSSMKLSIGNHAMEEAKHGKTQPRNAGLMGKSAFQLPNSGGTLIPKQTQGLSLEIKFDPLRSFCRSRVVEYKDIKIDVYFNGQLSTSALISARHKHEPSGTVRTFAGQRIDRVSEAMWLLLSPPAIAIHTGNRPTHGSHLQEAEAEQRWKEVSRALMNEAHALGLNEKERRPPSGEFLEHLADMKMPAEVRDMQSVSGHKYGVIDVVMTLGKGRKYPTSFGFLREPRHMANEAFKERSLSKRAESEEVDSSAANGAPCQIADMVSLPLPSSQQPRGRSLESSSPTLSPINKKNEQQPPSTSVSGGEATHGGSRQRSSPVIQASEDKPSAVLSLSKGIMKSFGWASKPDTIAKAILPEVTPPASRLSRSRTNPGTDRAFHSNGLGNDLFSFTDQIGAALRPLSETPKEATPANPKTKAKAPPAKVADSNAEPETKHDLDPAGAEETGDEFVESLTKELTLMGKTSASSDTFIYRSQNPLRRSRRKKIQPLGRSQRLGRAPLRAHDTSRMRPRIVPPEERWPTIEATAGPKLLLKLKIPSLSPANNRMRLKADDPLNDPDFSPKSAKPKALVPGPTSGLGKNWRRGIRKTENNPTGYLSSSPSSASPTKQSFASSLHSPSLAAPTRDKKRNADEQVMASGVLGGDISKTKQTRQRRSASALETSPTADTTDQPKARRRGPSAAAATTPSGQQRQSPKTSTQLTTGEDSEMFKTPEVPTKPKPKLKLHFDPPKPVTPKPKAESQTATSMSTANPSPAQTPGTQTPAEPPMFAIPELSKGSVITYAPGMVRQVKSERGGEFREEEVLLGVRFLVGA